MTILQNIRLRSLHKIYKSQQTLLAIVVIAILFASILAISWISQSRMNSLLSWILAGSLGMWGGILLLRLSRFEFGMITILLSASLTNFFTLPTGRESRVVISLVVTAGLIAVWFIQMAISKGRVNIRPSPINLPILLFVVVSFVSYIWSSLLRDPLLIIWESFLYVQLAALMVNILLPLLALMVSNKVKETRWLVVFTWVVIALGTFVIVATYLNLGLDRIFRNGTRGLFSAWVVSLALGMALFNELLSKYTRAFLLTVVAAWTFHAVVREGHWVSGWLPVMVAGAVITFIRSKKLFVAGFIFMSIIMFAKYETLYERIIVSNIEEGSTQRTDVWLPAIQLVTRHPLFGVGPAGYAVYYMTYHPDNARSSHNNYFDILAQTGFIGFTIFVSIFAVLYSMGGRLKAALRGQRDFKEAFAMATFGGLVAAIVAMMLGDWVIPFAYNQTITGFDNAAYTWIFLGGLVALYHIVGVGEKR
jgi:O-antigen ligase